MRIMSFPDKICAVNSLGQSVRFSTNEGGALNIKGTPPKPDLLKAMMWQGVAFAEVFTRTPLLT
ncbi:MAG: hypothetical protein Q4C87_06545 [Actinomycetaceae bacterium]|nr:hypothetical protein [Actinomycetaceae bacterium]